MATPARREGPKAGAEEPPDKVLLASFPKSGSNWVRYCIEHFSGLRTPGSERRLLVGDGPTIIDRTHFLDDRDRTLKVADKGVKPVRRKVWLHRIVSDWRKGRDVARIVAARRVILLLRNPDELFVRVAAKTPLGLRGYASNIKIFDACRRDKLLVYYEDLMQGVEPLARILDFIGIPHDLADFDVVAHRQRSLQLYAQGPDRPRSAGDVADLTFHSRRLASGDRAALRTFLRDELGGELYDRYLGRYAADAEPQDTSRLSAGSRC